LDDIAKTIGDVKEKEETAQAIDTTFTVADNDEPTEPPSALTTISV